MQQKDIVPNDPVYYVGCLHDTNTNFVVLAILTCVDTVEASSLMGEDIIMFRCAKPNITKQQRKQQFKSRGEVNSFGISVRYNKYNGVSLGTYSFKNTHKANEMKGE
eukprot:6343494-Ditylum_brightwellii.AAC.1